MYQIKLCFKLEYSFLPKEMDRLFTSFLKAATKNISEDLYQRLYDKSRSIMKTFTYSYYLPGAKFTADKILLDKDEFMVIFYGC